MTQTAARPLWEQPILRRVAGETLHPGGLALTDTAVRLAAVPRGARVLDIGCGLGATVRHLRDVHGLRATGCDLSFRQLRSGAHPAPAAGVGAPPLVCADAMHLPYRRGGFDAVFCECVLSLMPAPETVLRQIAHILRPGGHLIIADLVQRRRAPSCPGARPSANTTVHHTNTAPAPQRTAQDTAPSCATNALDPAALRASLARLGYTITQEQDRSRQLAELAARLVFAGLPAQALPGGGCRAPGYMLFLATSPTSCGDMPC